MCTIGPATASPGMLERLMVAGMDVARLNFSHGSRKEHGRAISDIRTIAERLKRPVAIMQDLAGPKIRIGPIANGTIVLESGHTFILTGRDVPGDDREVSLTYKDLPTEVSPGDPILLSDGAVELVVEKTVAEDIVCRVVVGGPLSSHKGVNLPAKSIKAPILTEKDRSDILFGMRHGVDYVALSFVRSADDVEDARRFIEESGEEVPLIAKIEKHEALDHIDEIVQAVDGIMVARGDLGVDIPLEHVPRAQKMLIEKANAVAIPAITATQMLKSMVDNPRPTRAEVTDVANAILDGSDAVMLSEETAVGQYPIEAVQTMSKIAAGAEMIFPFKTWPSRFARSLTASRQEAVAYSACRLAEDVDAAVIITCTQSGSTTRFVAKYRPDRAILSMTPDDATYRRLALVWGSVPMMMAPVELVDKMEHQALRLALESGCIEPGETAIVTAGVPLHVAGATNLIKMTTAE